MDPASFPSTPGQQHLVTWSSYIQVFFALFFFFLLLAFCKTILLLRGALSIILSAVPRANTATMSDAQANEAERNVSVLHHGKICASLRPRQPLPFRLWPPLTLPLDVVVASPAIRQTE